MNTNSIKQGISSFNDIEGFVFEEMCRLAQEMMQSLLQELDEYIAESRDKKKYRYIRQEKKQIRTKFGWVTYTRRYYKIQSGEEKGENIFLLDQLLEMKLFGKITEECTAEILQTAASETYRKSEGSIEISAQDHLSHQTIKNKVDEVGKAIEIKEAERITNYLDGKLTGTIEVPVLFEEKDGLFLSIQNEKKKKEIKLGKVYEGWEKESPGSDRYKTVNTMYFAGYEKTEVFDAIINSGIAEKYNEDRIELKVLNGDGASWIRKELEYNILVEYQVDLFHVYRKASQKIKDKKIRRSIHKLIEQKKYDELVEKTKQLYESAQDAKEIEAYKEVYSYYNNLREYLPRYTERSHIKLPEGKEYRGMGTMEGSIHNVLENRMKGRGMSWSEGGAAHMARILCLIHSDETGELRLRDINHSKQEKHEDMWEKVTQHYKQLIKEAKSIVKESVKELKNNKKAYASAQATFPCEEYKVTQLLRALKSLVKVRPLCG